MNDMTPEGEPTQSEEPAPSSGGERRALVRSREDRFIGGVAAGLGRYFGVDPNIVRLGFAVSLVIGGVGVLVYLVLLAAMPMEGDPAEPVPPVTGNRRSIVIGGTVLLGALLVAAAALGGPGTRWLFGFGFGTVFGVLLWVSVAAALAWTVRIARTSTGGGPEPSRQVAEQAVPANPQVFAASPTQIAPSSPTEELPPSGDPSDAVTETMPGGAAREGRRTPATFGRIVTRVVVGLAALAGLLVVAGISFGLTAVFGAIPAAAAVMVCGVAIVWLALAGRPAISVWMVGAAVAIAIPMAVVTIAQLDIEGEWGDVEKSPRSAASIPEDGYELAAGAMRIDMRGYPFRKGEPVRLPVQSGFGATEVIVPDDVCVVGDIQSDVGFIDMRGEESSGVDVGMSVSRPVAGLRVLELDSEFKLGYFGVRDATSRRLDRYISGQDDWSTERNAEDQAAARKRAEAACTRTRSD